MSERWMTDSDWDATWATMGGLWPKQVKAMGGEEPDQWRAALGKFRPEVVQDQLRGLYQRSKFMPRLGEVSFACHERMRNIGSTAEAVQAKDRAMQDEAERVDRAWADTREFIAGCSDADLRGHQRMIVATAPHFGFVARQDPRKSKGLQAQILARVRRGWGPDTQLGIDGTCSQSGMALSDVAITDAMLARADALMSAATRRLPADPADALAALLPLRSQRDTSITQEQARAMADARKPQPEAT